MYELKSWASIIEEYEEPDLFLGNGFSVKIWSLLNYSSLFETFIDTCAEEYQNGFRSLGTTNFEFILESISRAITVNNSFNVETETLLTASNHIRRGLINAVRAVHPSHVSLPRNHLESISSELSQFRDIFTTNYDILLYYIILMIRSRTPRREGETYYNDYYWEPESDHFLKFMNFQHYSHYDHVYFLHGALFLFKRGYQDYKIRRNGNTHLLTLIERAINNGNIPLFVSEGDAKSKVEAIARSQYLSFAFDKLEKKSRDNLVLFGFSMSDPDNHLNRIINASSEKVAYAMYTRNKSEDDLYQDQMRVLAKLPSCQVDFFDSDEIFNTSAE